MYATRSVREPPCDACQLGVAGSSGRAPSRGRHAGHADAADRSPIAAPPYARRYPSQKVSGARACRHDSGTNPQCCDQFFLIIIQNRNSAGYHCACGQCDGVEGSARAGEASVTCTLQWRPIKKAWLLDMPLRGSTRTRSVRLLLTPVLTPTPVNAGERPDTLDRQSGRFSACSCTSLNAPERTAAGSTTAGCRFDSCPTCP